VTYFEELTKNFLLKKSGKPGWLVYQLRLGTVYPEYKSNALMYSYHVWHLSSGRKNSDRPHHI
jgi:hypothetical protein